MANQQANSSKSGDQKNQGQTNHKEDQKGSAGAGSHKGTGSGSHKGGSGDSHKSSDSSNAKK